LAQLKYLYPRLIGKGETLSRLGGGIGTRGPGETKLEIDRRRIREKITFLEEDAKRIKITAMCKDKDGLPSIYRCVH
jgi:GTP-binding protein HflX